MSDAAKPRARLVLALPHELMLDALSGLLSAAGMHVVGRCSRAEQLERCVRDHAADLALLDADLAPDGFRDLVRAAEAALPGVRTVLLAPAVEPALAREAFASEVDGVLLKSATTQDFVDGLRRVAAGDAVFPSGWLAAARAPARETLSERQREVLELIAQGLPNEVIAERLFISKNTVKFHVAAIYQRLGVSNRVQAAHALRDQAAA
jgi:DNA-binding NarL/FixJ family response regulator